MRTLLLLLLLAVVPASLAVAQDKIIEDKLATPFFPLAVGTTWHYKSGEKKVALRVDRHEKLGDVLCAVLKASERDGRAVTETYVAVHKDGIYQHKGDGVAIVPPMLIFALPPKDGHCWKFDSKLGDMSMEGTTKTEESEVEVPAGKFKAWKVTTESDWGDAVLIATQFFVKDMGIVKVSVSLPGRPVETFELEKFEQGK
jgi:hypothetical protein